MSAPTSQLGGVHHVSTLSANIARSHDFYTRILGLRLLIKTVNQDAPGMYHLFFGDGAGSPGSDITVFDMPGAARELRGNNAIVLTTFRVAGEQALRWWQQRFRDHGIEAGEIATRDGRRVLDFEDFEGTQLSLVDDGGIGDAFPWDGSPVPPAYQLRGLGYTVITVPSFGPTDRFLAQALGLRLDREYPLGEAPEFTVYVYAIGAGGAHAEVHAIVRNDLPRTRYGAGGVHHVALRIPHGQLIGDWIERVTAAGYTNSGLVDRHYFASLYVREPNGVLFELATDGPGFDVDHPLDGEQLSLPPFLEPRRREIEAALVPLVTANPAPAGRGA
jgi:glyoxalase family protein